MLCIGFFWKLPPKFYWLTFKTISMALSTLKSCHVTTSKRVKRTLAIFEVLFKHISWSFEYFFLETLFIVGSYQARIQLFYWTF